MIDSPVSAEFLRRAFFTTDPIPYRRILSAIHASTFPLPFGVDSFIVDSLIRYCLNGRAGPTILDIPILSDLDSADLAIDELRLPPLPPPLPPSVVLSGPIPTSLTTPSPLESRDFPALDANPPLSSLPVLDLRMSPIAFGTSLRLRVFENFPASPKTGMRIGNPPFHLKNPRGCLIPEEYRLVWVVLQVVLERISLWVELNRREDRWPKKKR